MKDALDAAMAAPIRVRRGDDIFELTKVGDIYGVTIMAEKKLVKSESSIISDLPYNEWASNVDYYHKHDRVMPPDPTYTDPEEPA